MFVVGYGLGGGGGHDIVHTDEHEQVMPNDGYDSEHMPVPQPVLYPSMEDYDTSDTLTLDHNRRMPDHTGSADEVGIIDLSAEVGNDLKMLVREQPEAPYSIGELWDQSYASPNQYDDGGGTEIHMGQRQPWVAVDLDGTVLESPPAQAKEYGSFDLQLPLGPPIDGAQNVLNELARLGWRISIYTARFGDEKLDDETVERWASEIAEHLKKNGIPFSDIWVGRKPRADFFVDDKAIRFEGDWPAILEQLTLVDAPPRNPDATEGSGGPLDYAEDPNDFDDPLYDRGSRGVDRPPELEGVLFG